MGTEMIFLYCKFAYVLLRFCYSLWLCSKLGTGVCFLYFNIVGTEVSLNWAWDAPCFCAYLYFRTLSVSTWRVFTKHIPQKIKMFHWQFKTKQKTKTPRTTLSKVGEDIVSREWNLSSDTALTWKLRLGPLNYSFPLSKWPWNRMGFLKGLQPGL